MTCFGIAIVVFMGSLIGLYSVYDYPEALRGLAILSLFNAAYAWFVARVGAMAWDFIASVRRTHR